MNVSNISGNLAKDPEIRQTGTGGECLNLYVAVKRPFAHGDIVDYFHCISYDERDILYARKFLKKGSCMVINGYISFKKETKLGKYAYSTRLNIISMEGVARLKENAVREIPVQEQDTTVFPEEKTAIKENMPKQTLEESFDVMDCTQPGTELPL